MINKGLMTSNSGEWETPQELVDFLAIQLGVKRFDLDPCATAENAKAPVYFTKERDGLRVEDWTSWKYVFMNPPYGREIGKWVAKAAKEGHKGCMVVCLLPARTDTTWWHEYVMKYAKTIAFIRGRIRFSNSKATAPFPSAVVVFGPGRRYSSTPYVKSLDWRKVK